MKDQIVNWAAKRAEINRCGRMCNECAFKRGGAANNEPHNVDSAAYALAFGATFNCHDHDENGKLIDAGKTCVGFQHAKQYLESIDAL